MEERYTEGNDEGVHYLLTKADIAKLLSGEELSGILKNVTIKMVE